MAATEQSPEAKELSLIGKVELRIALADSDEKLQNMLKTYLAPLLLKLASPHAAVRNKIISVCSHINTRIKPDTIKLPVQALVEQFKAQNDVPLIRHFDLSYIHKGVPRLSAREKEELFPVILKGIAASSKSSTEHASQVVNLVFQLVEYFTLPGRGTEQDQQLRSKLDISDDDARYLASWFGKLILFTPVKRTAGQTKPVCGGLSPSEYSFLALQDKGDTWTPGTGTGLNLTQTKARVARLLASGLFIDSERFLPALFASADPSSAVSDAGEDMLKRVIPNTDFESHEVVKELFTYFFGTEGTDGRVKTRSPLRLKILGLLSKSLTSTSYTHEIIKMVDEGLSTPTNTSGGDAMEIDGGPAFTGAQQISSHLANSASSRTTGGLEVAKFRGALFNYINFVARHGKPDSLHAIAPRVLTRLRDFIEEQGWPKAASVSNPQELESRGYAYEVIGLLAKAGHEDLVVEPNLDVLRWLFRSQAEDRSSNNLTVSIDEALSTVLTAFSKRPLRDDTASALESLLLSQMEESAQAAQDPESTRRSTRYTAIRFANRCLPFASVRARTIDLMAIGAGLNDRPEVVEEGKRGLSPYWYRMLNGSLSESEDVALPAFSDLMRFIFYDFALGGRMLDESDLPRLVADFRKNQPALFADSLLFCRLILLNEALQSSGVAKIPFDSEWERKLNVAVESDVKVRTAVRETFIKLCQGEHATLIKLLLWAFSSLMTAKEPLPPTSSTVEATGLLPELCAVLPDDIVGEIAPEYTMLMPAILSNNHALSRTSARVFGILASHPSVRDESGLGAAVSTLTDKVRGHKTASGAAANQVLGATQALADFFSRLSLRTGGSPRDDEHFKTYTSSLLNMLKEAGDADVRKSAFAAIGELCLYQVVTPTTLGSAEDIKQLIDRIYDVAKTGNESAALALGQIGTILPESDLTAEAFDPTATHDDPKDHKDLLSYISIRLHKLHEIRTAESHFAVGEALSYLCLAWGSTALSTALDIPTSPPTTPPRQTTLQLILARTLKDCTTTKPSLRKASVIWLLCLVQFCGHDVTVQARLAQCQAAFKRCLVDRDELVQETASRGLGLVYEKGPPGLRDDLVRDLMSSFSADRKAASSSSQGLLAGQVGDETQLFEPGALPTGSGESVSTYRDIMNLANEVGDSSLVYRFMSMAASDAVWNSRAAFGRFGLSSLLAEGGNGVEDYLRQNPKVYVSLYRYRFDPNEGVRRSMNGIWNALVKDTAKTVDAHFDAIVEDLLSHIFGREWRTRQACCTALADLVQGRALERYEPYLQRIWDACFKVLDDIKESVRAAAASLARTLTGILTRTLEADSSASKNATAMLNHVLPFLLSPSGLESSAEEVRLFAVGSLVDIVNKASAAALRPSIPELVERLLGLMGSLEHQAVEYVRLNAKRYAVSEQKIDDMRLAGVRSSPIMAAIERCLDLLDDDTMQKLQPRLENAIKTAIALPTKVACSRVLVSLSTRRSFVFKPSADAFLKLLEKQVVDRNETVASSYATAAGYVARGASDKQLLRMIMFVKELYFSSDGDREGVVPRRSITAGDIIKAISKHANDRFNALSAEILPFVFIAKHDGHETVKELFQEVWEDNVGGSRAVALYLNEIITLAGQHLESPQWVVKHTAAKSIAAAVVAMSSLGPIGEAAGKQLWPPLEKALAAKTWDGKEVILKAFVRFVESGKKFWTSREDVKALIVKIAVREAKRQNPAYRQYSTQYLGEIARARKDIDMSGTVYDVAHSILEDTLAELKDAEDAMDVDGKSSKDDTKIRQAIVEGCVRALSAAAYCRGREAEKSGGDDGTIACQVLQDMLQVQEVAAVTSSTLEGTVMATIRTELEKLKTALDATEAMSKGSEVVELRRRLAGDGNGNLK